MQRIVHACCVLALMVVFARQRAWRKWDLDANGHHD